MPKTNFAIFLSWQSDTKGNHKIIRDAISAECQKQKEDNGYEINIDEATRDLPGSPKIEDAIFDKIAKADVFVCDITPVAVCGQKQMPNSNVIFELGYAFHTIGPERIIMLAEKGNWNDNDMPFDINHRRIGKFSSSSDCNLEFEINACVEYCSSFSARRIDWHKLGQWLNSLYSKIPSIHVSYNKQEKEILPIKATEESTILFQRRMAAAFPGERGVVEFTNRKEIIKRLSILLQQPLRFQHGLKGADTDPIWTFRAGSSEYIQSFANLNRRKVLLNFDEMLIKRLVVFRDNGRYYGQYVYVEVEADRPSGCSPINEDVIKDFVNNSGYYDEEFAVFKPSWYLPERKITRQEYDDGSIMLNGKHIYLHGRAKLRLRYLTPYNFIIAAKFSPFNCHEFDRTSEVYFKGMLNGTVTNEQFDEYMGKFPKKDF